MTLLAQKIENPVIKDSLRNITGMEFANRMVQFIISLLMTISIIYFLVFFILGGIHFIQSGGDKNKAEEAKHQLTNAVTGLAVTFLALVIAKLVGRAFGIEDLENLKIILPTL